MSTSRIIEDSNSLDLSQYIERFLPECKNGLRYKPLPYQIWVESSSSISVTDLKTCFDLLAATSEDDYRTSGVGWHAGKKLEEMKLPDLRYLLIRTAADNPPDGFASFMLTYEDGREVVYLYEIHLPVKLRGMGLGKKLLNLVERAGMRAGVEKAMLTVFVCNEQAKSFYTSMGYSKDEYSPEPKILRGGITIESKYVILSKGLR